MMSLRYKLLLLTLAASIAFGAAGFAVDQLAVMPQFAAAEMSEAGADVFRGRHALASDTEFLAAYAADYAAWDDSYEFVMDGNEEYKTGNLVPDTFKNLRINLLAIVRSDGTVVWAELRESGGGELLASDELFRILSDPTHPLVAHHDVNSKAYGVYLTPNGPMILGSAAITTSNREGAVRGAVIMGRLIDEAMVKELARRTNVAMNLSTWDADSTLARSARVAEPKSIWTDDADPAVLRSYTCIRDIFGKPALLLQTDRPRIISQRAEAAARTAFLINAGGSIALLAMLWLALSRMVIRPLGRVTAHAVRVGDNDDLRARLNLTRNDEIGVLSREFDRMVDRLARSRAETIEIAHGAGKAQVAASVLHNVGNVLNTVNVATTELREKIRTSEVGTVRMAAHLLFEHESELATFLTEDERGRQLPKFLNSLAEHLMAEQESMLGEVTTLSAAVEHIRSVVSAQQENDTGQRLVDWVAPIALVEQAISLSADSYDRHHIVVACRNEFEGEALLDRHRVLQVLVNLLANAKHALKAADGDARDLEVTVSRQAAGDRGELRITVRDNGIGIAQENIDRVFSMGYSSRGDGHGVGLHSCANLAREMGGSLTAHSEGHNRGATFVLSIPLTKEPIRT